MNVRMVDTEMWIGELKALIDEGYEVPLNVTGASMTPFLKHGRDKVILKKEESYKKGDIVLYRRANNQYILHRIVRCDGELVFFAGDAQSAVEGPLKKDCIIAKAVKIRRNGKVLTEKSREWIFFEKIWIKTIPARSLIFKIRKKLP